MTNGTVTYVHGANQGRVADGVGPAAVAFAVVAVAAVLAALPEFAWRSAVSVVRRACVSSIHSGTV
jgi:hypothetical protein